MMNNKTIYLKFFIKSRTIIWPKTTLSCQKQHSHEKSGLFQLFTNLLDIVKGKSDLGVPRCIPFALVLKWILFRPCTVSLLLICNIERLHNLDSVIDDLTHVVIDDLTHVYLDYDCILFYTFSCILYLNMN